MKIKTIKIHNYRAFYPQFENQTPKPYEIAVNGKNVLIYGENGSGKTSLFRAVRDFIRSSQSTPTPFERNLFVNALADGSLEEGEINLEFDNGQVFNFTSNVANNNADTSLALKAAEKASGWLTYFEILKTYLVDSGKPDLFDLLVKNILNNHLLEAKGSRTIKQEWDFLEGNINEYRRSAAAKLLLLDGKLNCTKFNNQFGLILKGLKTLNPDGSENKIIGIEEIINIWLKKYFKNGIEIEFNFTEVKEEYHPNRARERRILNRGLTLDITLNGRKVTKKDYQYFLNEARLSALAIGIFLAAYKTYPTDTIPTKILYLDDVFIGLDMSNRLPLLEIIEKEFIADGYQVFISTYDKAWYEMAKKYLVTDWCTVEMYYSKDKVSKIEYPIVLSPTASNLEKVEKFISICDYPAAANYLRKHIESLIKERLVEEDVRQLDGKYKSLQTLWERLIDRYENAGISLTDEIKKGLQASKISILNPLSHYSLSTPVYLNELNKAIKIAKDIEQVSIIKTFCFLQKGTLFYYSSPDYSLSFVLSTDWYFQRKANKINFNDGAKFKYLRWIENRVKFYDKKTGLPYTPNEIEDICKREYKLNDIVNALNKHLNLQLSNDDLIKLVFIKGMGNLAENLGTTLEFLNRKQFLYLFK